MSSFTIATNTEIPSINEVPNEHVVQYVDEHVDERVDEHVDQGNDELVDLNFEIPSVDEVLNEQKIYYVENEEKIKEFERKGKLFADAYKARMMDAIKNAINGMKKSSNKYSVQLNVSFGESLAVDESKILFHVVHYGGKPLTSWYKRKSSHLFTGLFKELQKYMLERGYYLLDLSDPSKSHRCTIRLYLGKPTWYDNAEPLWHGYNHV